MTYRTSLGDASCVTQAQHDAAVSACRYQQVKGLGAAADPCAVAKLPICAPTVFTYRSAFVPPSQSQETPPPPPEETAADEPNYMLWGGVALLLVAAGGYVAYKATRK